jgi:hypothetical protein
MNNAECFESIYNEQCANALESSNLVCENLNMHFWIKKSVLIDGLRSIETFVYNMKTDEGIIYTYRIGAFSERINEEPIDLNELRALASI